MLPGLQEAKHFTIHNKLKGGTYEKDVEIRSFGSKS
jgi:hypothetical protein